MAKTVLITGSTDGIGLATAKLLFAGGHTVLLHGRNPAKLDDAVTAVSKVAGSGRVEPYAADLSRMTNVEALAQSIAGTHDHLDMLINNAGVYAPGGMTEDGYDIRFAVNTFAPVILTQRLLPLMGASGRVINLSSAAQAPVDADAMSGTKKLTDGAAYAQSKLALTMWSMSLGQSLKDTGPVIVAVNPGSMLGSKMVKDAFGVAGGDIGIGADILVRAALSDEFAQASGRYFDNDSGRFGPPHPDALDHEKSEIVVRLIKAILKL